MECKRQQWAWCHGGRAVRVQCRVEFSRRFPFIQDMAYAAKKTTSVRYPASHRTQLHQYHRWPIWRSQLVPAPQIAVSIRCILERADVCPFDHGCPDVLHKTIQSQSMNLLSGGCLIGWDCLRWTDLSHWNCSALLAESFFSSVLTRIP